ncbi:MAG: glycosyltransferase [Alphaproteobacteria bacterium]|nr:glycosyltransferase [Alphaproteobacteria bacterium]
MTRKWCVYFFLLFICSLLVIENSNFSPKVSVVVPVYNTEKYLSQCLDSLKKQTLHEIEFIVIDDGSTDNSYQIMQEYAKQDKRFKIFQQINQGVGKTRNRGMELAKGEYIGFVDSDDYVSPNYFEKLYNVSVKYDADVGIMPNVMKFSENHIESSIYPYFRFTFIEDFSFLIGDAGQQWDKIYKKSFLDKHNIQSLEDRIWFEDEWFSTLVALYAKRVAMTDETIYFYRYNPNGISARQERSLEEIFRGLALYDRLLDAIENAGLDGMRKNELRRRMEEKIEWFKKTYGKDYLV